MRKKDELIESIKQELPHVGIRRKLANDRWWETERQLRELREKALKAGLSSDEFDDMCKEAYEEVERKKEHLEVYQEIGAYKLKGGIDKEALEVLDIIRDQRIAEIDKKYQVEKAEPSEESKTRESRKDKGEDKTLLNALNHLAKAFIEILEYQKQGGKNANNASR